MRELNKKSFSTADVMRAFQLGRNTLRLYEKMGLFAGMPRNNSGYREFKKEHVEDLAFILEAKNAGFTLKEIKGLLDIIRSKNRVNCGFISSQVSEKVREIEEQVIALNAKRHFLGEFLSVCSANNSESECKVATAGFSESACCN